MREEEKYKVCKKRQSRRSESERRCQKEDTDAGRAE
jgi:hypothetical protein